MTNRKLFIRNVVSIHALVRVRRFPFGIENVQQVVSIHALVRVRPYALNYLACGEDVSIHALVRVRHQNPVLHYMYYAFQSTHS